MEIISQFKQKNKSGSVVLKNNSKKSKQVWTLVLV